METKKNNVTGVPVRESVKYKHQPRQNPLNEARNKKKEFCQRCGKKERKRKNRTPEVRGEC